MKRMLERKDDLQCTVSATEVRDDGFTFHCMTNMNDYGKVRFSLTLVSAASTKSLFSAQEMV